MPNTAGGLMSGVASDDVSGPNASSEFGDAGQLQQMANSLKNNAPQAYAAAQQPQQNPGQPAQNPSQMGQPPQMAQPGQPPTQPPPGNQPPGPQTGARVDMNQVFPPMPEIQQLNQVPWKQMLRMMAYHPQSGPALQGLADSISGQRGPLY